MRILDAAENGLQSAQLTKPNELGWGDLRGALVHILDAEYGWFSFLFEGKDEGILDPKNFADIADATPTLGAAKRDHAGLPRYAKR